jgi:hypothetical protein
MSPSLVQFEAADERRDHRLVSSQPSRIFSREGGNIAELSPRLLVKMHEETMW